MAAYGALVSLMNDLELILNHPTHSFSFDDKQITSLSQTVHFLIHFMESYYSHGCSREAGHVLESRIASVAHAAHDVIESHVVNQIHAGSTLFNKQRSYFLLDLQKAIDNINFLKRKVVQFKERSGIKTEQPPYLASTSSELLTSEKNILVGLDDGVARLIEMLIGGYFKQPVIRIVGMGGMGKTTLTKNAYDSSSIKQHFDVRLWATISQEYSVEVILIELLSGERKSITIGDVSRLGEELYKMLWGRRYLIVLDDMWSEGAWDKIRMFLPNDGNGSRVIVTTRLSDLAVHLSSSPFEMNFLDRDQSWELFSRKVFGEEDYLVELEEIGKRIVERCRGLPLSIIVLGGILRKSSRAIEYWEEVSNYMNPISGLGVNDQCSKIVSLSYHHLPVYLKPCFLYMGTYAEDEWINAFDLIQPWIAEGFLKPNKGLSLEEVGENCLKDLINRNLILVCKLVWNGRVEYCKIHDIMREFCLEVAKEEKFFCVVEDNAQTVGCRERRVVIPNVKLNSDVVADLQSAPLLRSLKYQGGRFHFDELPVELRLLRLSEENVNNILSNKEGADFQQANLRYLAFSYEKLFTMSRFMERAYLRSSISLLWNMQTLIIRNFDGEVIAPYEIWEIPQLRHLEFSRIYLPDPLPADERSNQQECIVLQNLHTLVGVQDLRLTEEVCRRMPNIKKLSVTFLGFPGDCSYYCPHNLGRFSKLKSLDCSFGDESEWLDVVMSLTFPSSLEELSLGYCHLHWEDVTLLMKRYFSRLGCLLLSKVQGSEWDIGDEDMVFPSLKMLMICACSLVDWKANSSHFPNLEILYIVRAPEMNEIPSDIGEIPTLELIYLKDCSVSFAVSAMRIMVEQEDHGNESLHLDVCFDQLEELERFEKILQEEDLTSNNLLIFHGYHIRRSRPFEL